MFGPPAQPPHEGTVLAVEPRGRIVLSLGTVDGVQVGYEDLVARGEVYVGTAEVVEVREHTSTALIMRDISLRQVEVGDRFSSAH
jgi:cell shape-determining protein MreC